MLFPAAETMDNNTFMVPSEELHVLLRCLLHSIYDFKN